MNPSQPPPTTHDALQHLRSRLQHVLPGSNVTGLDGSFTTSAATRPLTDEDIVVLVAQHHRTDRQFAHFDPDAFPLALRTAAPATIRSGAEEPDEVDEDFLATVDAARAEPGGALIVVIRLPDHAADGPLAYAEIEQLHAAVAERAADMLSDPGQLQLGGSGSDVLALIRGRHVDQDFRRRLSQLAEALANPVPVAGRHAPIRAHLALAPLTAEADTAAALRAARAALPVPEPLEWTSPAEAVGVGLEGISERAELLQRARMAIAAGRFVLLYRDIHSTSEPGVVGARAIPAWIDTDGTEHTFTELEDVAAGTGLTREIFDHTLPALCNDLLLWRGARRRSTPHVLLEVPDELLREGYLHDQLPAVLQAVPVPPSLLILGISAAALAAVEGIDEHLHWLSDLGVQLAITGYGDTHTPIAALTRRRWNLAVIPPTVLAKLEDRHPDGVNAERTVMQALVRTAELLKVRLLADDTPLRVVRRYLINGLHIPPCAPITAVELAERTWIELPEFPPERPEPSDFSVPRSRHGMPMQRTDR